MRILGEFASTNEPINRLIESASRDQSVQGIVIEMSHVWIFMWRLREVYGYTWLRKKIEYWRYFEDFIPFRYWGAGHFDLYIYDLARLYLETDYWIPNKSMNLQEISTFREDILSLIAHDKSAQFAKLFTIRICLYPSAEVSQANIEYTDIDNFQIIYETRPISYLFNNSQKLHKPILGGISIGTGDKDFGTLGGILMDINSKKHYGVTCAHVVMDETNVFHPAKCDSNKSVQMGTVSYRSGLRPLPPEYYKTNNLSTANEMDLALIEISELADKKILEIGNVNDIVSDEYIVPHIGVSFTGRSSGHKEFLFLDGEIVFYDLHMDQTRYRFKNLMQVRITGKISNFVGTPTKDGDSGAWLCTQNHKGTSWCGMIIGGFEQTGYAISAEKIINWIIREAKLDLALMK